MWKKCTEILRNEKTVPPVCQALFVAPSQAAVSDRSLKVQGSYTSMWNGKVTSFGRKGVTTPCTWYT